MRISLLLIASSLELVRSDGCNCHDAPGDWIRYAEPLAGTGEEGYLCTQLACCPQVAGKYGSASDGLCCEGNIMNDCCRAKCSGANETSGPIRRAECDGESYSDDGRGCPGGCGATMCCLGEYDGWCSDNYRDGFVCENNACGDDDCCVPGRSIGLIIGLVVAGVLFTICVSIGVAVFCCVKSANQRARMRFQQQNIAQTIAQTAPYGGGGTQMGAIAAQPAQQMMQVIVPAGMGPGSQLTVTSPLGQQMVVTVPNGVGAGQPFMVSMPAPQPVTATAVAVPCA